MLRRYLRSEPRQHSIPLGFEERDIGRGYVRAVCPTYSPGDTRYSKTHYATLIRLSNFANVYRVV